MIFQPIKVEISVIPHFRMNFTEKFISYTILMFQGHSQGQFQGQACKNIIFKKLS